MAGVPPVQPVQTTAGAVKGPKLLEYAVEVECNEPDTRHFMHRW